MNSYSNLPETVFFEPWNMGDALIAAYASRGYPTPVVLACNSKWHPLLKLLLPEGPTRKYLAVDLPYTTRNRKNSFDYGNLAPIAGYENAKILSIRGDLRDYWVAKKLFPHARIQMAGWLSFAARRLKLLNFPFKQKWADVTNRYESWAKLSGVPLKTLTKQTNLNPSISANTIRIMLHVGAQWRSRQYPYIKELRDLLRSQGFDVIIVAGPGDPLPEQIESDDSSTLRLYNEALVQEMNSCDLVITNDSGPMHLSAFLRKRTLAIARVSDIHEWLPPGARYVSNNMPRGYAPDPFYCSDRILEGWPSPQTVLTQAVNWLF